MECASVLPPFFAKMFRRAGTDCPAMAEYGRIEAQRRELALAAPTFLQILEAHRIAETDDIHAHIARN
jgi:hypothetical protein